MGDDEEWDDDSGFDLEYVENGEDGNSTDTSIKPSQNKNNTNSKSKDK